MKLFSLLAALLMLLVSAPLQSASAAKAQRINVIFDNDMGNDVDDIFALDLVLKYHKAGRINLLGVMVNRDALSGVAFVDLYDTWCGLPNIPIGFINKGSNPTPEAESYSYKVWQMERDGKPLFPTTTKDLYTLPDAVALYRELLAKAPDKSVVILSTGFSTNLMRLLYSSADRHSRLSGRDLLKKKVAYCSVMAGNFDKGAKGEFNVIKDIPAAQLFFENTPVPLIFSDFPLGKSICYPASSIEHDFAWAPNHPLVEAYKLYGKMPYDRPMWDALSALYMLEPDGGFFGLSEKGSVTVSDKGITTFKPSAKGMCRYLTATDAQRRKVIDFLVKEVSKPWK